MTKVLFTTICVVVVCVISAHAAHAHTPVFPEPKRAGDLIPIEYPEISHAFYGTLNDYPHTYEIVLEEPTPIFAEVLVPVKGDVTTDRSALIVRQEKRGVSEVARLRATEASWETFFEPFGGDRYRKGASFDEILPSGSYLL